MRRVLVARPVGQEHQLLDGLRHIGIEGIPVPAVSIAPADEGALARLTDRLDGADWLVITSVNGAAALARALDGRRLPPSIGLAAVGPATAHALREAGLRVDAVPAQYLTMAIADALGPVEGKHVVLARADIATPQLREALLARGARVEEIVAYRTIEGPAASRELLRLALDDGLDAILFTSGSTVRGLLALVPPQLRQRLTCLPVICIGPITARSARHAGFAVAAVASEHTGDGLVHATAAYFAQEEP